MQIRFQNRFKAGRFLAGKLMRYAGKPDVIVLALPRGGVPVAAGIARELHATLDILMVRKLGLPGLPELAMGAIGPNGHRVLNQPVIDSAGISAAELRAVIGREERELARRERQYRDGRPAPEVRGRTVVLVDDGIATGATMRTAVLVMRAAAARYVLVAAPVAARESYLELREISDEIVVAMAPREFGSVGQYYTDFSQTSDEEVCELLAAAQLEHMAG
jgi:putative phosphoribosyl transferase